LYGAYAYSNDDEENLQPKYLADVMSRLSDHTERLLTASRVYWNSLPELPQNWRQINPNLKDYHSDAMEICSTYWIADITDWWRQQAETPSQYPYSPMWHETNSQ
jgi:hypothetical protein